MSKGLESIPGQPTWLKRYASNPKRFKIVIKRKRLGDKRKEVPIPDYITKVKDAVEWGEKKIAELSGLIEKPKSLERVDSIADEVEQIYREKFESGDGAFKTLESFRVAKKHVVPWFNESCPYVQDMTEAVCNDDYVRAQRRKNSTRYLGNDIKAIRAILKRAFQKGLIPRKYSLKSIDDESDDTPGLFIPFKDQDLLVSTGRPEMRVKCALGFLSMRNTETRVLNLPQVDIGAGVINLEKAQTKVRRARMVYLSPFADAMLSLYLGSLSEDAAVLFPGRKDRSKPVGSHKKAWASHKFDSKSGKLRVSAPFRFHDCRVTALTIYGFLGLPYGLIGPHAGVTSKVYEERYLKPPAKSQDELEQFARDLLQRLDRYLPQAWRPFIDSKWTEKLGGGKLGGTSQNQPGAPL